MVYNVSLQYYSVKGISVMREIGGYIEFEHYRGQMLHEQKNSQANIFKLNSGISCLAYLIKARRIHSIVLPYFICSSVTNLAKTYGVTIRQYKINSFFCPIDIELGEQEYLYVVNYYGQLTEKQLQNIVNYYHRVIIDNAHAYFDEPLPNVDTLYTCRKFFGVPDGAILYTDIELGEEFPRDESHEHMKFLLGRFERSASEYYADYEANNRRFASEGIKHMSLLTENLLHGVDYSFVKMARTENYRYLYDRLREINELTLREVEGAFAYPLLVRGGAALKKVLIAKKLFIPTLWPNVLGECTPNSLEYRFANDILPIPVDQRYTVEEMEYICNIILSLVSSFII
mgnify:CR=1 FL=1